MSTYISDGHQLSHHGHPDPSTQEHTKQNLKQEGIHLRLSC